MKVTENCEGCGFHKGIANKAKGVKIPIEGVYGKCTRKEGLCDTGRGMAEAPKVIESAEVPAPDEAGEMGPLSATENQRRAELEDVIERNFKAFVETGQALAEIRNSRLYRSTHSTFEGYCKDLWEMCRVHADRLINSASVIDNLKPIGFILPANEAQARPLARLEPDQQRKVWEVIVHEAEGTKTGRVTASLVSRMVARFIGEEIKKKLGKTKGRIAREEVFTEQFRTTFGTFLEEIDRAYHEGWRSTSKEAALKYIDELRAAILREA